MQAWEGSWDQYRTCTLEIDLNLRSGDSMTVDSGAVLAISGAVVFTNAGTVTDFGSIVIKSGALLNNSGINSMAYMANGTFYNNRSDSQTAPPG